ncbi:MAG: primosomal protein N', partial [Chromatiales bacterium]|nr:primosomal protein N' [Chromatiales bacterium]
YLQLAKRAIERGRQVLILVPEIGLTPQIVDRVRQRLDAMLVVLHSGLADGARASAWLAAKAGRGAIVLGTRSAVFAPLPKLGLIVVDEEHDLSYKQQDGLRYSARDLALVRAREAGVPILLGSATPSLESLWNVQAGRYHRLQLRARAAGASPPRLEVVDIRARVLVGHLSPTLLTAIGETLAADQQVLLFVNRRGFAPALLCHACGEVCGCSRCDAKLVLHRRKGRLQCHHCGLERAVPRQCPQCTAPQMIPVGLGTERLEEELTEAFPDVSIARVDRDTTRRRGELEATLEAARRGATRILIGTQMLAKGHHFPGVTLVAILDADSGLFSSDFRASERLAQMITQVAGRAGRADNPGRVLIQTHQPDHPLLRAMVASSYADFAIAALDVRANAELPPVTALAMVRAEAPSAAAALDFLSLARDLANPSSGASTDVTALGPVAAPMERRQGRFRAQLLLQAQSRAVLQRMLTDWIPAVAGLKEARRVRWSLDVDPQDMA